MSDETDRTILDKFVLDAGTASGGIYLMSEFPFVQNPSGASGPQTARMHIFNRKSANPSVEWTLFAKRIEFPKRIFLGDAASLADTEIYVQVLLGRKDKRSAAPYRILHGLRDGAGNRLSIKPAVDGSTDKLQIEQIGSLDVDTIEHSAWVIIA